MSGDLTTQVTMVSDAVATVVLDAPLTTRLYLAGNTTTHTFMSGTLRSSPTEHVIVDYDTVVHLTVTLDSDPATDPTAVNYTKTIRRTVSLMGI